MDLDGMDGASLFEGPVTVLFGNVDGGAKDFAMVFVGTNSLSASDFIFGSNDGAVAASNFLASSTGSSFQMHSQLMTAETQLMIA
jgi:hypothetical protein